MGIEDKILNAVLIADEYILRAHKYVARKANDYLGMSNYELSTLDAGSLPIDNRNPINRLTWGYSLVAGIIWAGPRDTPIQEFICELAGRLSLGLLGYSSSLYFLGDEYIPPKKGKVREGLEKIAGSIKRLPLAGPSRA